MPPRREWTPLPGPTPDTALIPLGPDLRHVAIVDTEDLPLLIHFGWMRTKQKVYANQDTGTITHYPLYAHAYVNQKARAYVAEHFPHYTPKSGNIFLHRLILQAPKTHDVDHINGDGLDNRKTNLRLVTHAENQRNQKRRSKTQSGYKGVHQQPNGNWCVRIVHENKRYSGGTYEDPQTAARYYDRLALHLHQEHASLNFPDSIQETLALPLPTQSRKRKDAGRRYNPESTAAAHGFL